jgi:hypothetical protein
MQPHFPERTHDGHFRLLSNLEELHAHVTAGVRAGDLEPLRPRPHPVQGVWGRLDQVGAVGCTSTPMVYPPSSGVSRRKAVPVPPLKS